MATTSVSAYLADPTHFTDPDPDYAAFQAAFGPGNAADRTVTASAVLGLAARSPVVIAFVLQGDEQCIHVCHSLSKYPEDPLDGANPFNNLIVGLVGDDLASSVPIVFPVDAWARTNEIRCFNGDCMIGANDMLMCPLETSSLWQELRKLKLVGSVLALHWSCPLLSPPRT